MATLGLRSSGYIAKIERDHHRPVAHPVVAPGGSPDAIRLHPDRPLGIFLPGKIDLPPVTGTHLSLHVAPGQRPGHT